MAMVVFIERSCSRVNAVDQKRQDDHARWVTATHPGSSSEYRRSTTSEKKEGNTQQKTWRGGLGECPS